MKTILYSLVFLMTYLFHALLVHAQTEVGFLVNENTTWTLANSPYIINHTIQIIEGVTLTIEPGVVVKHNDEEYDNMFLVQGTLLAQGTDEQPIIFTTLNDNVYPTPGDDDDNGSELQHAGFQSWKSIVIAQSSGSSSIFTYCKFRYGGSSLHDAGSVVCQGSSPTIDHCHFYWSNIGLEVASGSNPIVTNTLFESSQREPIRLSYDAATIDFSTNTLSSTEYNGIQLISEEVGTGNYTLPALTFANIAYAAYMVNAPLTIAMGDTLTIEPGVIIKYGNYYGTQADLMLVNGTVIAEGTSEQPIIFTSLRDDFYGGDTNNDGSSTTPVTSNSWKSVTVAASSGSTLYFFVLPISLWRRCTPTGWCAFVQRQQSNGDQLQVFQVCGGLR